MNKTVSLLLISILTLSLIVVAGCSGGKTLTSSAQSSSQTPNIITSQTDSTAAASGQLRNENWLLGTWSATVPKTATSFFAGKKINLSIANVKLVSNEEVHGRPTGQYSYSGNLVWDTSGEKKTLGFGTADQLTGDSTLSWGYSSPAPNQYMENISIRVYDMTYSFELDWGPQVSKPDSTFKSLGFYGSIQNLDTSNKDDFDPSNMIIFTQTSSTAPPIASITSTTTFAGSFPTKTTTTTKTSSPTQTTTTGSGTGDIWSDIPIYPNAKVAEDEGFALSLGGDESYSQNEWHFFASTDDFTKVVDYYKKQMPANGWAKMMWADIGEMSYGSFEKNSETRMCLVYVIKGEEGTAMNIMSAAK